MKFDLLNKQLIGFAYLLRSAGFQASPDQSKSFLMAIRALGPESLKDIRLAARSVFGPSPEKSEIFDELFDQHFLGAISIHAFDGDKEDSVSEQAAEHLGEVEQGIEDHGQTASKEKITKKKELSSLDNNLALKNFLRLAPKRLPERISRRTKQSRKGKIIDRARTFRLATKNGGEIFQLFKKKRRVKLRPILVLIDVSGSMKSYTEAALNFAHALINLSTRVEVFSLGTELTRLTVALKPRAKAQALSNVYQLVDDFDGGTNLGETLSLLLNNPRHAGFARGAVVISISDGLEIGNSEALLSSARKLYSLAFAHIWLTPLANKEHFIPETEALKRIEPYVDEFGSAISIAHICAHLLGTPIVTEAA